MPTATKATLISCDPSVKQILLWHNDQLPGADKFVIQDLDATHVVVKTSEVDTIEERLNDELEKNHYDPKTAIE